MTDIQSMQEIPDLPSEFSTDENPELASQMSERALADSPMPDIRDAPIGHVELPGGWIEPTSGKVVREALVRELNGRDEEKLSRIDPAQNMPLWLNTLVESAVENIGGQEVTKQMVGQLLVGDREALVLGIRIATYGADLPMTITCPQCGVEEDLSLELDKDIPIKEMEDPSIREFDVELRNGRHAVITPATVSVQDEVWDPKRNLGEIKTHTIARCVRSIDGKPVDYKAAQDLGLADRRKIIDRLEEIQPGPNYEEVRLPCEACGAAFLLPIGLGDLFR